MTSSILALLRRRRAQLRLSARMTIACLVTFALGHLLHLAQSYWAVLTAVIVMQASVGGSLKAIFDRFFGSLGGAACGVAVSVAIPHHTIWGLGLALAAAVTPLSVLAAMRPTYRIAPVTAIILLLTPLNTAAAPWVSALARLFEIGLGSLVALSVVLFVFPARAHGVLAEAAGGALNIMSELTLCLLKEGPEHSEPLVILGLHDRLRAAIGRAEASADEAARERANYLTGSPDPDPLVRTLRRLRNDLILIARATAAPLPPPLAERLREATIVVAEAVAAFLKAAGAAIVVHQLSPSLAEVEAALAGRAAVLAEMRRTGFTREMTDETLGRLFGLSFGLEQFSQNLHDLADRANEMAHPRAA